MKTCSQFTIYKGLSKEFHDTDQLNSCLSLLTILLYDKHAQPLPELLDNIQLVQNALQVRPPCRWEKHIHSVKDSDREGIVEVILDMGHNPAAITALLDRLNREYPSRHIRYDNLLFA